MKTDLHLHSCFSDGVWTPEEIIKECKKNGLKIVSITDHDTIDQMKEAIAAGENHGIQVITGTEISCVHNEQEFHLLAYDFTPNNQLKEQLDYFKIARQNRAKKLIQKLQELGFAVEKCKLSDNVGRPHIAAAVMNNPDNAILLKKRGISNKGEFIEQMLCPGKPAYVKREKMSFTQAVKLVHDAKGVCVLAHPGWTFRHEPDKIEKFVRQLVDLGLDGIETFYNTHNQETTELVHELAKKFNLIETAGSDFHDPHDPIFNTIGKWQTHGLRFHCPL